MRVAFVAYLLVIATGLFLRWRGSPESKPVGAPHSARGVEG